MNTESNSWLNESISHALSTSSFSLYLILSLHTILCQKIYFYHFICTIVTFSCCHRCSRHRRRRILSLFGILILLLLCTIRKASCLSSFVFITLAFFFSLHFLPISLSLCHSHSLFLVLFVSFCLPLSLFLWLPISVGMLETLKHSYVDGTLIEY